MRGKNLAGLIIVLIGLSILFRFFFFNVLVAVLVIWIGIRMMGKKSWRFEDYKGTINEDELDKAFIFTPVNKVVESDDLKGGKITCVFSGGEIDFRKAKTSGHEIDLEITNVFAGLKIYVPKDWKINLMDTSVVGGVENKTKGAGKVVVNLKGSSVFGGMEIVN